MGILKGRHNRRLEQQPTAKRGIVNRSADAEPANAHKAIGLKDARLVNEAIASQHAKLIQRANWLNRRMGQLHKGSNGRKRCDAERIVLLALCEHLRSLTQGAS